MSKEDSLYSTVKQSKRHSGNCKNVAETEKRNNGL